MTLLSSRVPYLPAFTFCLISVHYGTFSCSGEWWLCSKALNSSRGPQSSLVRLLIMAPLRGGRYWEEPDIWQVQPRRRVQPRRLGALWRGELGWVLVLLNAMSKPITGVNEVVLVDRLNVFCLHISAFVSLTGSTWHETLVPCQQIFALLTLKYRTHFAVQKMKIHECAIQSMVSSKAPRAFSLICKLLAGSRQQVEKLEAEGVFPDLRTNRFFNSLACKNPCCDSLNLKLFCYALRVILGPHYSQFFKVLQLEWFFWKHDEHFVGLRGITKKESTARPQGLSRVYSYSSSPTHFPTAFVDILCVLFSLIDGYGLAVEPASYITWVQKS